jgi:hypothetical protein
MSPRPRSLYYDGYHDLSPVDINRAPFQVDKSTSETRRAELNRQLDDLFVAFIPSPTNRNYRQAVGEPGYKAETEDISQLVNLILALLDINHQEKTDKEMINTGRVVGTFRTLPVLEEERKELEAKLDRVLLFVAQKGEAVFGNLDTLPEYLDGKNMQKSGNWLRFNNYDPKAVLVRYRGTSTGDFAASVSNASVLKVPESGYLSSIPRNNPSRWQRPDLKKLVQGQDVVMIRSGGGLYLRIIDYKNLDKAYESHETAA